MSVELQSLNILETLGTLSEVPLICSGKSEALTWIAELTRQALMSHLCTVALVDLETQSLTTEACAGCTPDLERVMVGRRFRMGEPARGDALDYALIASGMVIERGDLQTDGQGIIDPRIAAACGVHWGLCCPLQIDKRLLGYLNHFSSEPPGEDERKLLDIFARQAVSIIHSLENAANRERLEKLNRAIGQLSEARTADELLKFTLSTALDLVGTDRGWISRLDLDTGRLDVVEHAGNPRDLRSLEWGKGITGKALIEERSIRADDVHDERWRADYEEFWSDTCSELAIPIVDYNAEVRVDHEVRRGTKPIGVLNLESPRCAAFSGTDEALLESLARQAAVMIERVETDRKLGDLARVQQEILAKRDWEEVMQVLMDAIMNTLRYHFVNVSIVVRVLNVIRTEYVRGVPQGEEEEFKRLATHSLDSEDIQADIVRLRRIEVPGPQDKRFDARIYDRFLHSQLIRVYVPMIVSADQRVMGTVEAGYQRKYRRYIYERDVQVLKGFVDYAVQALEQKQRGLLDKISHELRAPVVGIRSNASYLQHRRTGLSDETIDRKLDDILADCENLLFQVKELEHILGRKPPEPKIARTLLFRDVIIKTLRQLKPLVLEHGFTLEQIEYDGADMYKIEPLYVDRSQINQVVYNLLINAIKYAEDEFRVQISVERTRDAYYVVKFRDWGMGVRTDMMEKIFDDGFRTPEATTRYPNGSGLGLTIARKIMHAYGGDLRLASNHQPTEFQMILPKSLKEKPHDSIRR